MLVLLVGAIIAIHFAPICRNEMSKTFQSNLTGLATLITQSVLLMRPLLWVAAVGPYFAGVVFAGSVGFLTLLGLIPVLAVVAFAEIINDLSDRRIDPVTPKRGLFPLSQGSRLLTSGRVSARQAVVSSVLAVLIGLSASVFVSPGYFAVVFCAFFSAFAYSMPPLRLKGRPILGWVLKTVMYGDIAFLGGVLSSGGALHIALVPLMISSTLFFAGLSLLGDIVDIQIDSTHGVTTLPVLMGYRKVRVLSCIMTASGMFLFVATATVIAGSVRVPVAALVLLLVIVAYAVVFVGRNPRQVQRAHLLGIFAQAMLFYILI